jgi:ABC-type phosphate/phosphonate transport system substrate-binding protein
MVMAAGLCFASSAMAQEMACWFVPGSNGAKSKAITEALTKESGITISPRVATNYPEIFKALSENKDALAYVGSFAATLLNARGLAVPLVQKIDGKEMYSGVMIYPKGGDAAAILRDSPADISFATGASSGESSAKAATAGKAAIGVKNHMAAANAVKAGKAKAAFVKNYWWDANKDKFPDFQMHEIPGISVTKCPDNVLMAASSVPQEVRDKVIKAAVAAKEAFGATRMEPFDAAKLDFPLELMTKGGIDPKTYAW